MTPEILFENIRISWIMLAISAGITAYFIYYYLSKVREKKALVEVKAKLEGQMAEIEKKYAQSANKLIQKVQEGKDLTQGGPK